MPLDGKTKGPAYLLLDMGLDRETRQLAEKLCEETDRVGLCRPAELNLACRENLH